MADTDAALLTRLRDLSLVDVDALLAGASDSHYVRLLATYAEDLSSAIGAARQRMAVLVGAVADGPEPLAIVDTDPKARAQDAGREAGARAIERLRGRADACRQLAMLDDLTAALVAKLLEVDRRTA